MFSSPLLSPNTVHLWRIDLEPSGGPFPDCLVPENDLLAREVLSDEEFAKASRFVSQPLRLRYAAAHVAMRFILGSYLKRPAAEVVLAVEKMGRPIVDFAAMQLAPSLFFNLSHTEDIALLAVGSQNPLGVDIEAIREMKSRPGIDRQVYTETERQRLLDANDSLWFDHWTAKEAVLKATGYGFYLSPLQIEIDPSLRFAVANEKSGASRWLLHRCPPSSRWSATLATSSPIEAIDQLEFPWQQIL
ncbi:4'-phosphopantetheinyl transferase family protein [Rosistilla oblonga]|uniref:4'-phosphopantetheinyl transferase family protein n=1 Tax=Rosistilla oblonga TaxID=2527990 RepID=UPI003A97131D